MRRFPPERIVCLTEETVETHYLLDEQRRIVGVSGYAARPPQVRCEKPRVSAFTSAGIPKILALDPDLVLSDLQADIVAELIRAGVAVHAFDQRDIAGIPAMIRAVGAPASRALRRARSSIGSAKSTPVTLKPAPCISSDMTPVPQPRSSALRPSPGRDGCGSAFARLRLRGRPSGHGRRSDRRFRP